MLVFRAFTHLGLVNSILIKIEIFFCPLGYKLKPKFYEADNHVVLS